jgi:hypothetical protein
MIEVLKQALKALIQARKLRFALWRHGCDCRDEHTCNPLQDEYAKQFNDSIIKLEQAIAELESQETVALEALAIICVKCRSNEWGPDTPRKQILNWFHDTASKALEDAQIFRGQE